MIKKRIKKLRKKVPEAVVERATNLAAPKPEEAMSLENVPQITNETIAEHREEVLGGARKFIYPLAHSKRRIIIVTSAILIATLIALLAYSAAGLYKYYQHNAFLYRVTQVLPFPVARVSGSFVNYENYLFELRRQIHYYEEQQGSESNDFSAAEDLDQLQQFRKDALERVVSFAYVKSLADQNGIKVSSKEVEERITQMREQNRLGSNDKVFADVLRDFWGWSIADFKRSLKDQILVEKVTAKLDTEANQKAEALLTQAKSGADFAALAKSSSGDPVSAANGGDYGLAITKSNPNVPPQVINALYKLKPGKVSGIINTGSALEIVKLEKLENDVATARHIVIPLKDIKTYIDELKAKTPPKTYIRL
jgi:parvulin-like peptidyl-prolyl isomerase